MQPENDLFVSVAAVYRQHSLQQSSAFQLHGCPSGIRREQQLYNAIEFESPFSRTTGYGASQAPHAQCGPFGTLNTQVPGGRPGKHAHMPTNSGFTAEYGCLHQSLSVPAILPDSPTSEAWSWSTLHSQSSIGSTCSDSSTASLSSCSSDSSPRRVRGHHKGCHSCPLPSPLSLSSSPSSNYSVRSCQSAAWQQQQREEEQADTLPGAEPTDAMQTLTDEIQHLLQLRQKIAAAKAAAGAGTAAAAACDAAAAKLQAALQHALAVRAALQQSAMDAYAVQLQQCKMKIAAAANLKAQLPGNPAARRHLQRVIAHQQRKLSLQQQLLAQQLCPQL